MLVLSAMDGAGAHRLAAAHVFAVGQLQPQPLDDHVALHVGLLVDGELDHAAVRRAGHRTDADSPDAPTRRRHCAHGANASPVPAWSAPRPRRAALNDPTAPGVSRSFRPPLLGRPLGDRVGAHTSRRARLAKSGDVSVQRSGQMAVGFTLSDGQQELQKNAQTFAEAVLRPTVERIDRAGEPGEAFLAGREAYREMAKAGFTKSFIPTEYGGAGFSMIDFALAAEELTRVDINVPTTLLAIGLGLQSVIQHGTPEQKQRLLRPLPTSGGRR